MVTGTRWKNEAEISRIFDEKGLRKRSDRSSLSYLFKEFTLVAESLLPPYSPLPQASWNKRKRIHGRKYHGSDCSAVRPSSCFSNTQKFPISMQKYTRTRGTRSAFFLFLYIPARLIVFFRMTLEGSGLSIRLRFRDVSKGKAILVIVG